MCGKDTKLCSTKIEGTILNVCDSCAKYGEKVRAPVHKTKYVKQKRYFPEEGNKERIVKNYASLIRTKREQMNLKQEEFAKMLTEKESIIHKIESGTYKPSISMAKKIERQLGLKLREEIEIEEIEIKKTKGSLTIGDMLKLK
jgi:putative transcription factor